MREATLTRAKLRGSRPLLASQLARISRPAARISGSPCARAFSTSLAFVETSTLTGTVMIAVLSSIGADGLPRGIAEPTMATAGQASLHPQRMGKAEKGRRRGKAEGGGEGAR